MAMNDSTKQAGSELFIVDNSDRDWKVARYLRDWCRLSSSIDIATGNFEIGALLELDGDWQKVDRFRILMGNEVTRRTKQAVIAGLRQIRDTLDRSVEAEKEHNEFLDGVPAVVESMRAGKIAAKVYRRDKFHAKAYITRAREEVLGSFALVGSSNFSRPGLTDNIELNVQITGRQVAALQAWYDEHWKNAEDITADLLRVLERHTRDYTPFDVYVRALQWLISGHEMTVDEWEHLSPQEGGSRMLPVLDQYQIDGYRALMKIAQQHRGAFLCDGVGLGKTFIGLMLIERLAVKESKRVVLFAPKAAVESVWKPAIRRYLPHVGGLAAGDFSNLVIFSHTDLSRGGDFPERFNRITELAHAVIIDEAHHFRNPGRKAGGDDDGIERDLSGRLVGTKGRGPSRYRILADMIADGPNPKSVFLLTATPINNKLADFRHMAELFSEGRDDYFSNIGIHSLRGHFTKMERELQKLTEHAASGEDGVEYETNMIEAEQVLVDDSLFGELVVQRSRKYAVESQKAAGATAASFPDRKPPQVATYSVKKTYGHLLEMVEKAFHKDKPLFSLAIYYPLAYYTGDDQSVDAFAENRQKQVVGLIRTGFLKRFESSSWAFERSCERLMLKLLAWATKHSSTTAQQSRLERWRRQNSDIIEYVEQHQFELFGDPEDDPEEDVITDEMLEAIDELDPNSYDLDAMLSETFLDLDEIVRFLQETRKVQRRHTDDKLKALVKLMKSDPVLKSGKALIFTEFADTAQYLERELKSEGIDGVTHIDSQTKGNRLDIIRRFAPYYNDASSADLENLFGTTEIRVLISTDVLSEGLNLQDCTRLINYDIHWNPVRLMQRIGRVDRRMNPEIEARMLADHPELKGQRGKIVYWNFLPPDELNDLLSLYSRVTHKTLRISKTLGIEHGKLLKPDDNYEVLREFTQEYEGELNTIESLDIEFRNLLKDHPDLEERLAALPLRVFSGKESPSQGTQAVFFCYVIPRPDMTAPAVDGEQPWTESAGETVWILYDLRTEQIATEPAEIVKSIRSNPDTPRRCEIEREALSEIRKKIDKHIKNTHLKALQAPLGVKPSLKAWMELN
ncbi:MAG: helicase-related protein [Phycisphaerales bacterium]